MLKPINTRYYILFCMFYGCMEILQGCQWYIGISIMSEICPPINRLLTYIAYLLIWLQPVMFSYIAKSVNNSNIISIFDYHTHCSFT